MNHKFWSAFAQLPRVSLAQFPTPLLPLLKLSKTLGGVELWCKRDDLISFGLGGNKVRGLELLIADALTQKADIIVTGAGIQSNHVRATTAAAAYCDLRSVAVFWGDAPDGIDGNYRVTRMLGAEAVFTGDPDRASVDSGIINVSKTLSGQGFHPYAIPRGGACALGAISHVLAAYELYQQCIELNIKPEAVMLAVGSGGTHAGWLLGTRALGTPWRVESFTVSRDADEVSVEIARIATEASVMLGADWQFTKSDVVVHGGFVGKGYGIPSPEAADAIRLVGRTEGMLLDPVYTGKAMAGLIDLLRRNPEQNRTIVFLHTGGEPAFFAGNCDWLDTQSRPHYI